MLEPQRPTLRDLAAAAGGMHPSTVSLALRNSRRISAATCRRVQEVARQLGYHRDPLLDAFNRHRIDAQPPRAPRHIAVVADFGSAAALRASPRHALALAGARAAAAELFCKLELFLFGPGQPSAKRLDSILDARGIGALLLLALRPEGPAPAFAWERYCYVAVDSPQLPVPAYTVTVDYRQAGRLLWRLARAEGRRRIGFVWSDESADGAEQRAIAGYLFERSRESEGSPVPPLKLPPGPAAGTALRRWAKRYTVDAIVCRAAFRALAHTALGDTAPPCMAFDDPTAPTGMIRPDYFQVGRHAVEQLVALMQTNHLGPPPSSACTYLPIAPDS